MRAASRDFQTDEDKITWAASLLMQKRKDQWRNYADSLRKQNQEVTWKMFCDYLTGLLSNPEIRNQVTQQKIEKAKQTNQYIADFDQYLNKLYSELDYNYDDQARMFNLRNKCDSHIRSEAAARSYEKPTEYTRN